MSATVSVEVPAAQADGPTANSTATARPLLGWSSWSFVRQNPTAQTIEAQAKALKDSGLAKAGFVAPERPRVPSRTALQGRGQKRGSAP